MPSRNDFETHGFAGDVPPKKEKREAIASTSGGNFGGSEESKANFVYNLPINRASGRYVIIPAS